MPDRGKSRGAGGVYAGSETVARDGRDMNILYISSRLNAPDGSAVHGREFVKGVAQLGHRIVTIPALIQAGEARAEGGAGVRKGWSKALKIRTALWYLKKAGVHARDWVNFGEGVARSISQLRDIRRAVRSRRPDVIVYRQHLFDFAPLWASRLFRVPLVVEVNSLRVLEERFRAGKGRVTALVRWAERQTIRRADYLYSVSRPIKEYLDAHSGVTKATVIPNGVDVERFDPARFDRDAIRENLGLTGKTVLGYVGSYKRWHGLDITLDAVQALVAKDSRYHLLLIGKGECYAEVCSEIERRGLTDAATRIESVAHDEVPRYLAAFDYALMTYPEMDHFYFSPLKMFEYLAMGIPVVATEIGQIGEILAHNATGLLVHPPAGANFAAAVESARRDPEQTRLIGAKARRLAVEHYSWQANAEKVMAVCRAVLERRDNGRARRRGVGVSEYD